jgi:hypothetical protein
MLTTRIAMLNSESRFHEICRAQKMPKRLISIGEILPGLCGRMESGGRI